MKTEVLLRNAKCIVKAVYIHGELQYIVTYLLGEDGYVVQTTRVYVKSGMVDTQVEEEVE